MNNPLRHSLHALADLTAQSPRLQKFVSSGARRRRRRTNQIAREAGWLGAGLVVGAGLTSLFTPSTGAEVRKRLSNQAMRLREFMASRTNGAAATGPTAKKNVRDDRTRRSREDGGFEAHA
jgi:hypothetical protein